MAESEHAGDESKHVKMSVSAQVAPNGLSTVPDGDPATIVCLIPSFADATKLVSAPYSCLVMDTHRRHIALSPMYLKKKKTGIQEELNTELLRYSDRLKGVPLAYDNIKILGQHGDIYDDNSYIHMDIEASFVVFQPKRGQKLLGKVNKLGVSHAGCLVHGCFNASVPKPNLVSVDTWREAGPRIGTHLEFEVSQIDADTAGVLLIRGRLDRTRVQELLAMGESSDVGHPTDDQPPDTEPTPEPVQESPDDTPKKKKKKKRDKLEEEATLTPLLQQDGEATQEPNGTTDNTDGEKRQKKKKKKDKRLKEEEEEVVLSSMEVHGSDSSGYLSDKPSKKRRLETGSDVTSGLNGDPETPKSKKKRKSDIQQFT
ncbi:DNA-directed RNA polymerase I subunit RPA43 [Polymixia lowei]